MPELLVNLLCIGYGGRVQVSRHIDCLDSGESVCHVVVFTRDVLELCEELQDVVQLSHLSRRSLVQGLESSVSKRALVGVSDRRSFFEELPEVPDFAVDYQHFPIIVAVLTLCRYQLAAEGSLGSWNTVVDLLQRSADHINGRFCFMDQRCIRSQERRYNG